MKKLALFIKTIYREKALFNCVDAIKAYSWDRPYRIYIADDGPVSDKKESFYKKLKKEGHCILKLAEGTGASASRNALLEKIKDEAFILRMDDDFEINSETKIEKMVKILEKNDNIGVIADLERQIGDGKGVYSGQINTWQGFFIQRGDLLIKKIIPLKNFNIIDEEDIKYIYADFTRNMLLIKREVFDKIRWNESLKFSWEHEDFLLQLKKSDYDIVFTLDSIHYHREDIVEKIPEYMKIRNEHINDDKIFFNRWGIKKQIIRRPVKDKLKAGIIKMIKYFNKIIGNN